MSVMYSQNGCIVKQTASPDWFGGSPNFTMSSLYDPIVYGTVTNSPSNRRNGILMTSALDLAQARTVEFNVKYRILGWNQESKSYPGQFYTDNASYRTGIDLSVTANSLEVYYYMNGNSDSQVTLYNDTDLSFSIQDVIEFKYIADNQANTVYAKVQQNGNNVMEQTFNNVTGLVFADNMPYNFLGVRFTVPASYASAAQLYLDSTNFKADGSVVWGSTKV